MIVYHGSAVEAALPDVYHSREYVDFGKGFYITPIKEQASKWAARFKRNRGKGIISAYELDIEVMNIWYRSFRKNIRQLAELMRTVQVIRSYQL